VVAPTLVDAADYNKQRELNQQHAGNVIFLFTPSKCISYKSESINNNNTICIAPIKSEDTEALGCTRLSLSKQMCLMSFEGSGGVTV